MKTLLLILVAFVLSACDKPSSDGTYERAKKESEAGKDAQNGNLAEKAQKMEDDLRRRYRFYSGVSKKYNGKFKIKENEYVMSVSMSPTIHVVDTGRVRTLEEIQDDLNNLFLIAEVKISDLEGSIGAPGCVFKDVKPDIMSGTVRLIDGGCGNTYTISVTVPGTSEDDRLTVSTMLAREMLDGTQIGANHLYIDVSSRLNPNGYGVLVEKKAGQR